MRDMYALHTVYTIHVTTYNTDSTYGIRNMRDIPNIQDPPRNTFFTFSTTSISLLRPAVLHSLGTNHDVIPREQYPTLLPLHVPPLARPFSAMPADGLSSRGVPLPLLGVIQFHPQTAPGTRPPLPTRCVCFLVISLNPSGGTPVLIAPPDCRQRSHIRNPIHTLRSNHPTRRSMTFLLPPSFHAPPPQRPYQAGEIRSNSNKEQQQQQQEQQEQQVRRRR